MRNTVTVAQTFPTWAAAYAVRERFAEDEGFDRYGIDQIEIERLGREFELLIRTDEFHRDQIEHLLRSSGTTFNPPRRASGWPVISPALALGAAAAIGVALYTFLSRARERRDDADAVSRQPAAGFGTRQGREVAPIPMFTLEVNDAPIAVTKGSEGEARAIFDSPEFKRKLRGLESDGRSLWNGFDPLTIRPAREAEIRALVEYAEKLGLEDEEEGDIVLYLQPIDTADEFDETQDG